MLIEFSVTNFRSIREKLTWSMEAEHRLSERDKSVDERNVASTPQGRLLRVAGLYGANASGKTNVIRGLYTLRWLVLHSARSQEHDPLPADPFRLDEATRRAPSEVEVLFAEGLRQLRYGVAFTRERVLREWLHVQPRPDADEQRWFERHWEEGAGQYHYETGGAWQRQEVFEGATHPSALHLSTAAQLQHAQAREVVACFRRLRVLNGLSSTHLMRETTRLLEQPERAAGVQTLVQRLGLGIERLELSEPDPHAQEMQFKLYQAVRAVLPELPEVEERAVERSIVAFHRGQAFELHDESAGTERAIALAGPILQALAEGQVLVVDEFEARLHTLLSRQLIELFQDPAINTRDAQLLFASHDTNLLTRTLLRRDQIWFTERSPHTLGTELYSLAELALPDGKKVRNDARYEQDYLQGRYGAIPFFGNLKALLACALGQGEAGA